MRDFMISESVPLDLGGEWAIGATPSHEAQSDLALDVSRAMTALRRQGDGWAADLLTARYGLEDHPEVSLADLARQHKTLAMAAKLREAEQLLGQHLAGYTEVAA